ncbi:MAG: hypothetical protein LDL41_05235 [Coleofasciculus sp. S288]|nr:hypothetical protein [Coleofasciculus sp. S288]
MVVDADDCVSKYLAEFVEPHHQGDGWFFNKGYEYKDGSNFIYFRTEKFYLHCGTSNIIRYDFCQIPENPETIEEEKLSIYAAPHHKILKIMAKRGAMIDPLPFAGAVYIINNGENNYSRGRSLLEGLYNYKEAILIAKEVYKGFNSKFLTRAIRDEFGLYDTKIG